MRHSSPKDCRDRYGLSPHMARVSEEAERLLQEARNPTPKPDTELELMREHGVSAEQIDAFMRGEW